jgi:transcriptional regulator with XRE-family HTH domain
MIRNDHQLARAATKHREALDAARDADGLDHETYTALAAELRAEIDEYRSVRDGFTTAFPVNAVDDLADALVKARIARRWTQRQLAEALGVSEQMVQRDEAGGYERARLARIADVADVLAYELHGVFRPRHEEPGGRPHTAIDTIEMRVVRPGLLPDLDPTASTSFTGTVSDAD